MPPQAPNSLGRQADVDLVSYLLEANGNPAGNDELPTTPSVLERIVPGRAGDRAVGRAAKAPDMK